MGMRFRKSINLGGGFRVNLSKSGAGYSWGTKGVRFTKKSGGGSRSTLSIPGTGVSWVNETGSGKKRAPQNPRPGTNSAESFGGQKIENAKASGMVSAGMEDLLSRASKALLLNRAFWILFWVTIFFGFVYPPLFISTAIMAALLIWIRCAAVVKISYEIEDDMRPQIYERIAPALKAAESRKVWRLVESRKSANIKYSSGASDLVKRNPCKVSKKAVFPFKSDEEVAVFKSKKETLLFFPDKLIIIQGLKVGALSYEDIRMETGAIRYIETEAVPKDTQTAGSTWKYVNKSGGPDKRFADNRQYPICLYGEIDMESDSGLNVKLMYSKTP